MEIRVLTVFAILVNILFIIYYLRNTPGAESTRDHRDVVRDFIEKNNIKIKQKARLLVATLKEPRVNDTGSNSNDSRMNKVNGHGQERKNDTRNTDSKFKSDTGNVKQLHSGSFLETGIMGEAVINDLVGAKETKNEFGSFVKTASRIFVYSAYYDDRRERAIRLVAFAGTRHHPGLFCVFEDKFVVNASFHKSCETHNKEYGAYLISCPVPRMVGRYSIRDKGITLMSDERRRRFSHLNVTVPASSDIRYNFTVCIPPLYGHISHLKLVEFIEVTRILGANHFTFYDHDVSESTKRVLAIFGDNVVEVKPWKHPLSDKVLWYKGQSASVWDCLLHNMYSSAFVAFNDIDEYIVPRITNTWSRMIKFLNRKRNDNIAGYRFKSVVFDNSKVLVEPKFSSETQQYVTLNTIIRALSGNEARSKLMINPRKVFELGIHHLSKPIDNDSFAVNVKMDIGLLHHYRQFEDFIKRKGKDRTREKFVEDYAMWRYRENILQHVNKTLALLRNKGIEIES